MIDVHVLIHEGTKAEWLDRCLASLKNEPATVHVINNSGCAVGPGRAKGYARGEHPLVSYLDSDDELVSGTYQKTLAELETHRSVCTLERVVTEKTGYVCPAPKRNHAVTVYHRSDVLPYLNAMRAAPWFTDVLLREALRPVQLEWVGVNAYVRDGTARSRLTKELYEQEKQQWLSKLA